MGILYFNDLVANIVKNMLVNNNISIMFLTFNGRLKFIQQYTEKLKCFNKIAHSVTDNRNTITCLILKHLLVFVACDRK